jgi:hypothetical protein
MKDLPFLEPTGDITVDAINGSMWAAPLSALNEHVSCATSCPEQQ